MRFLRHPSIKALSAAVLAVALALPAQFSASAVSAGVADAVLLTDAFSDSQTSITLVWEAPADNGTPITGYAVLERQGAAPFALVSDEVLAADPLATTFTLTGLAAGTNYDFKVAALSDAGDLSDLTTFNFSNIETVTTQSDVPAKPTTLSVTASTTTSLTVAWSPVTQTGGSAIVDYALGFRAVGDANFTTTTLAALFSSNTFTGLQPDTEYEVTLTAENVIGAGPTSDSLFVRTDIDGAVAAEPVVISSVDATVSGSVSNVTLRWSAPSNGGAAITGYAVQLKAAADAGWSDASLTIASNATSVTFDAATKAAEAALADAIDAAVQLDANYAMSPGDQATFIADQKAAFSLANYQFQVAALNSAAPLSAVANFSDPVAFTLPQALAISTATGVSSSSITLAWAAPTVVMNSATTGYAVRYRQTGATDWVNFVGAIASPTATITGLAASTDYEFQAATINGLDQGAFGATASAKTSVGIITAAPDAVVVTSSSATGTSVTINFTAPGAHNSAITGYALAYRAVGAANWTNGSNLSAAALLATITGLTPGTAYEVKVAALNGVATTSGTANWMTPVAVTTLNYATAPVFGASTATATSIQVSWSTTSTNGGSAVTGYSLGYRVVGAGNWTLVTPGNILTYQLSGLPSSTNYEFEIAAINGVGTGAYSAPTQVATQAAPVVKPAPVTILFALNSAVLTAASQKSIKAWAAKVSKTTLITLDGYAAGTAVKKVKADSAAAAIAKARATAVAKYLKTLGWASSKIVGHGAATPVSKTDPNKNRRVVLSAK
ncbi:MAG: hypothetical protein RL196_1419 [Actinomycetota bacterium]|jgi:outer membrane protein OmpA-like peptidoglycan-associated protein